MSDFKSETLRKVLRNALGLDIKEVAYEVKELKGGTVGEVKLVEGVAKTMEDKDIPYCVVYKRQQKWERYGDPDSWRREYDLYKSDLGTLFTDSFRWPNCYHAEISDEETNLWMEYMEGVSGEDLTAGMYEEVSEELGRFQGKLYAKMPEVLNTLRNLSKKDYSKNFYLHYRSWNEVYDYIREEDCPIPGHLCHMLINLDEKSEEIWKKIEKLPVVLCHRDFWVANIFYAQQKFVLLDWDTAGWGYLGEDIASLVADEADVVHMVRHYQKCVSAYYRGFSEYVDISHIETSYIKELMLFLFGYRLVESYKFADTEEEKMLQLQTLQKIYEMET